MANYQAKPPKNRVKIKKGEVRNPLGAGAHDPVKKEIKKLTADQVEVVMTSVLAAAGKEELQRIKNNPESTILQLWVVEVAKKALARGDFGTLNALLDRVIGRVKEKVELSGDPIHPLLHGHELIKRIAQQPGGYDTLLKLDDQLKLVSPSTDGSVDHPPSGDGKLSNKG